MFKRYTSLDEIAKDDIYFLSEYDNCYYIKLKSDSDSEAMWKVEKNNNKIEYFDAFMYMFTPIDSKENTLNDLAKIIVQKGEKITSFPF